MAKSASMRWRGWRTTPRGDEIRGPRPRKCKQCKRPFRSHNPRHRLCKSCFVERRNSGRRGKIRPKKSNKPATAPVSAITRIEKRERDRQKRRRAESKKYGYGSDA